MSTEIKPEVTNSSKNFDCNSSFFSLTTKVSKLQQRCTSQAECPGGADSVCNGKGNCSDGTFGNGTCQCWDNFSGYACEHCSNEKMYGTNCTQECTCQNGLCNRSIFGDGSCDCFSGYKGMHCEESIAGCQNLTCTNNSRCTEANGTALCKCDLGYESVKDETCQAINNCLSSPCDPKANCTVTGPATHYCQCQTGYTGDGTVCDPINPCNTNNGGCFLNSTLCAYVGPGKHVCDCLEGYENYKENQGCILKDMCAVNGSQCHHNASCMTIGPLEMKCKCKEGYIGDGSYCFGNIIERLNDLNENHYRLEGLLFLSKQMLQKLYSDALTQHGPFTVFVPVDKGFEQITRKMTFAALLNDTDRALQIIRQHIVVGQLSMSRLQNTSIFYTLQGNPAEIQVRNNGSSFRYRIHGSNNKAKIVAGDIAASNGIIHVINMLMTNEAEIRSDHQKSIWDQISKDGRYNRFSSLVKSMKMEGLFYQENITVFASSNSAWDSLPEGTLDYFQNREEGKIKLRSLLKNHVYRGKITIADLVNRNRITSDDSSTTRVTVLRNGQIQLNWKVNISQADLSARNGIFHHIETVLAPSGGIESLLPRQCDLVTSRIVSGSCGHCKGKLLCPAPKDKPLTPKVTNGCRYYTINAQNRYVMHIGCRIQCNRTYVTPRCCTGFYSYDCLACPGGFTKPCNKNGHCLDGVYGNGSCLCKDNFMGTACEFCSKKKMFGPYCNKKCSCIRGSCDEGPSGTGKCKNNTCHHGYTGENCDRKLEPCGQRIHLCHFNSYCFKEGHEYKCLCNPGYEGDGFECREIDPCSKPNRGDCHLQAECMKVGPGKHRCECHSGWVGDGYYCYPAVPCILHRDCHKKAICRSTQPGKSVCTCREGYHGNGTYCELINACLTNNGGCHAKAECTPNGPGQVNCTCSGGYDGNGVSCFGTISQELGNHPNLTRVKALLEKIPYEDFLSNPSEKNMFTFFAPTDSAVEAFQSQSPDGYWNSSHHILDFFHFHTIENMKAINELKQLNDSFQRFETYFHGMTIHFYSDGDNVWIFAGDVQYATIITSDILAVNGYIHVIDKVLEPMYLTAVDDFFELNPDYSEFGDHLMSIGLLDELIDNVDGLTYTIFAPNNEAMDALADTEITKRFLEYYIVPKALLTASISNLQTEETMLGNRKQLKFTVNRKEVFVNDVKIIEADHIMTEGVIHGIDGVLHPILHRCDVRLRNVTYSSCLSCMSDEIPCPPSYTHSVFLPNDCTYSFGRDAASNKTYVGCRYLCENITEILQCCSGYYGKECSECPGGAEEPCTEQGACNDGITGNGTCTCDGHFTGPECDDCIDGWAGEHCDIDTNTCTYENGGCSPDAVCQENNGKISCTCLNGFAGNGLSCKALCEINNGGCHPNAVCTVKDGDVSCTCIVGFYGDGKTSCEHIKDKCNVNNGECSKNAQCEFESPTVAGLDAGTVTCTCFAEFVGDGRTCNKDVFDTVSHMSETTQFLKSFILMMKSDDFDDEDKKNLFKLLENKNSNVTLFVPVNGDWSIKALSTGDILDHLINGIVLYINTTTASANTVFMTEGNGNLTITSRSGQKFYVNGIPIIKRNIPNTNGIIHLIGAPLRLTSIPVPKYEATTGDSSVNLAAIISPIVVGLFIIAIVIIVVIIYRRSRTGNLSITRRSGSCSSFAVLHDDKSETDDSFEPPSPLPSTSQGRRATNNFENPLFSSLDESENSDQF